MIPFSSTKKVTLFGNKNVSIPYKFDTFFSESDKTLKFKEYFSENSFCVFLVS